MADTPRRAQIEAMLRDEPKDPFLRYALAMELVGEGDLPAAARQFQQVLDNTPDYVPVYFQYGQTLTRLGDLDGARRILQQGEGVARKADEHHTADEIRGLLESLM